jgi:hypothetical protein
LDSIKAESPIISQTKSEPSPLTPVETDFEHEFKIEWKDAHKVAVAGEFNGWKPVFNLKRAEGSFWRGKIKLPLSG